MGCCRALTDENAQHETAGNRLLKRLNFSHAYCDGKAVVFPNHHICCARATLFRALDYLLRGALQFRHLLFRATYSDLPNFDCRQTNANRNRLTILAADSNTLIELE